VQAGVLAPPRRNAQNRSPGVHRVGLFRAHLGDYDIAAGLCEESVSLARRAGSLYGLAMALRTAGDVAWFCCQFERAAELFTESLALYREIGDDGGVQWSVRGLGIAVRALGDYAEATRFRRRRCTSRNGARRPRHSPLIAALRRMRAVLAIDGRRICPSGDPNRLRHRSPLDGLGRHPRTGSRSNR
jgi:hypothetical protein